MPRIPDYPDRQGIEEEPRIVLPATVSPIETGLHESIHIVIARLVGRDIADVIDQDDKVLTRLVEPQRMTVAALMAPEVYMTINNVEFTDWSVSDDRNVVAECFKPEGLEEVRKANWEWLELVFLCPYVCAAISILSDRLDRELREHGTMDGTTIHGIIDPILARSPHKETGADDAPVELHS